MTQKIAQRVISLLVLLATIDLEGLPIAVNAAGRVSPTSHRSADLHIHKVHATSIERLQLQYSTNTMYCTDITKQCNLFSS